MPTYYYRCMTVVLAGLLVSLSAIAAQPPSPKATSTDRIITFRHMENSEIDLDFASTDIVPVIYDCDKIDLHHTASLDSVARAIDFAIANPFITPIVVWIGGSASPEGPLSRNIWLGENRAAKLRRYINENTALPDSLIQEVNLEEDWSSLRRDLISSDIPARQKVIDIIDSEPNRELRKRKIQSIDGGHTWQLMLSNLFPAYRNARVVIVAEQAPMPPVDPLAADYTWPVNELSALSLVPDNPRRSTRFFAVKNNLLFDALLVANLGFEVELWPKWSIDVPVFYSPYDITSSWRIRLLAIQPELRRWLGKQAGEGHFVGLYGQAVGFNVSFNDHLRYQDPNHALWGVGISLGWAKYLDRAKHWGIEFNLGVGYANYHYRSYHNWPNGQLTGTGSGRWWGPTRAGITIAYKWHTNRRQRTGIASILPF